MSENDKVPLEGSVKEKSPWLDLARRAYESSTSYLDSNGKEIFLYFDLSILQDLNITLRRTSIVLVYLDQKHEHRYAQMKPLLRLLFLVRRMLLM